MNSDRFPCGHAKKRGNIYHKWYPNRRKHYPVCYACVLDRNARYKRSQFAQRRRCLLAEVWRGAGACT